MGKFSATITVFLTGVAVTILEVCTARIVGPYFGSTIYVWGGAIGTVLAALAVGYWLGGKVIDRHPQKRMVAIVLVIAAMTTMLIPWMYNAIGTSFVRWSYTYHVPVGVAVMVMMGVLFIVPIVALGMVSPMVLRLSIGKLEEAGSWSGLLSGFATFGSILGTLIASFVLVPLIGTRLTIISSAALLLLIAAMVAAMPRRVVAAAAFLLLLTGTVSAMTPYVPRNGVIYEHESPYQLIQVIERFGIRYLVHDTGGGYQSSYQPGAVYTKTPYDALSLLPYLSQNPTDQRSVLVIGLGGGNMLRLYHDLLGEDFTFDLTGVEIDASVIDTAKRYFDLSRIPMKIVHDDARHFLGYDQRTYDIIIVDAYTHELQIPTMLATQEFFQSVRDRLAPGGVLGINALAWPTSRYFPKFLNTVAAVYPEVYEGVFEDSAYNHMIFAGDRIELERLPLVHDPVLNPYLANARTRLHRVPFGGPVYTDDRTDLDLRVLPFLN